jgi:hypothetical protein
LAWQLATGDATGSAVLDLPAAHKIMFSEDLRIEFPLVAFEESVAEAREEHEDPNGAGASGGGDGFISLDAALRFLEDNQ